ncbi:MAG: HTH-type transcriptional repressor [Candidatus Midichloriaceae bacterium]|jgi:AcrR family transcriptional regulator|nr:HTH-type transcriptional repressor [Candidatus Midichloriaceae bacterium]
MKKEPTKEKILAAARKLFVTHGFAGTSIGKIAKLANVNNSLIFHYFENKEALWCAVKQSIVEDQNKNFNILPSSDLPFVDFLRVLIAENIKFYQNNPDIMRMIGWQRLEHKESDDIGIKLSAESKLWIKALNHYKANGEINSDFKTEFILTLILAITSSAALDKNSFIKSDEDKEAYISLCVDCLQKALK